MKNTTREEIILGKITKTEWSKWCASFYMTYPYFAGHIDEEGMLKCYIHFSYRIDCVKKLTYKKKKKTIEFKAYYDYEF